MPDLGVIGELIVKIKAEDAKETAKEIKDVQKTTKDAGMESRRQIPVLERMGRRWEMVLGMVAATGAVLFGLILKGSPHVMGTLKGMQLAFESIFGLIGEELAPIFEWLEEILWKISEAFENLSPEMKTFVAGLTLAVIVAGVLAAAALVLAAALPAITAAVAAVTAAVGLSLGWIIVIIGAVALAVALLFTAWKHNWGGIQDKTKAALQFIRNVIGRVTSWIKSRWEKFLGIVTDKNLTTYGKLKAIWGWLKETIYQIVDAIKKEAAKAWEAIKTKAIEIWGKIKVAIPIILEKLKDKIDDIWEDIKASAAELWEDIKKVITDKIQAAYDSVIEKLEGMKTKLKETIKYFKDNPIVKTIKTIIKTVRRTIGGSSSRQFGGPVSAGAAYTVGEVGPELFVPNVSGTIIPNNRIADKKTTPAAAPIRPINIKMDLKLDGRTVWESMRRYSAAEIRRLGG